MKQRCFENREETYRMREICFLVWILIERHQLQDTGNDWENSRIWVSGDRNRNNSQSCVLISVIFVLLKKFLLFRDKYTGKTMWILLNPPEDKRISGYGAAKDETSTRALMAAEAGVTGTPGSLHSTFCTYLEVSW